MYPGLLSDFKSTKSIMMKIMVLFRYVESSIGYTHNVQYKFLVISQSLCFKK